MQPNATLRRLRRTLEEVSGRALRDDDLARQLDGLGQPGAAGLRVARELLRRTPGIAIGELIVEAFRRPISRETARFLLGSAWRSGAAACLVVRAAGSREAIRALFAKAAFPVELPPDGWVVWRGGCGDRDAVAAGYSWTTRRAVAATWAMMGHGLPVLLRRHVHQDEVAMVLGSDLLVLTARGLCEAVGTPAEIEAWAAEVFGVIGQADRRWQSA